MSWKKLIPSRIEHETFSDNEVQITYTDLENMIMKSFNKTSLTDNQRRVLSDGVVVISDQINKGKLETENHSSPNDLYNNDGTFRQFAIDKVTSMAHFDASVSKVIVALRNYAHPKGWLAYKKLATPFAEDKPVRAVIMGTSIEGMKTNGN